MVICNAGAKEEVKEAREAEEAKQESERSRVESG